MCLQQENTINRLKDNLNLIREKRQVEVDIQLNEVIFICSVVVL
jgi:hypothetical protein